MPAVWRSTFLSLPTKSSAPTLSSGLGSHSRRTAGNLARQPFPELEIWNAEELVAPAMAAMEAPSISVETAIPVEPSIAVELMAVAKSMFTAKPAIAMELAAAPAVAIPVSAKSTSTPIITVPAAPAEASAIVPTAVVTTTPIVAAPISVVPGAGADEHAVHKPIRPVKAVWRTRVGVIIIVAVGANRRRTNISRSVVSWPRSNTHNHSLCARKRSAKEANA